MLGIFHVPVKKETQFWWWECTQCAWFGCHPEYIEDGDWESGYFTSPACPNDEYHDLTYYEVSKSWLRTILLTRFILSFARAEVEES